MTPTNLIDLKTGYPDSSLVPRELLTRFSAQALAGERGFQYAGEIAGSLRAREQIGTWLATVYERKIQPQDMIITTGALHAIDIACRALTLPGDVVVVESPTFYYGVTIIQASHVQIIGVPMTPDGISVSALETVCRTYGSRVKVVYTIPAFHNPTGINASLETRRELIALSHRHHFTIVEDVTYQPLYFDAPPPPVMGAFDGASRVVSIASVSKLLMPAMRVGWMIAAPDMIERLKRYKGDGGTSLFNTEIVSCCMESGEFDAQVKYARGLYAKRHHAMVAALRQYAPDGLDWEAPGGGYFIWLTLPDGVSSAKLTDLCETRGVQIFNGSASYADGSDDAHIRLCFAYSREADITHGVEIVCACVRELADQTT